MYGDPEVVQVCVSTGPETGVCAPLIPANASSAAKTHVTNLCRFIWIPPILRKVTEYSDWTPGGVFLGVSSVSRVIEMQMTRFHDLDVSNLVRCGITPYRAQRYGIYTINQ